MYVNREYVSSLLLKKHSGFHSGSSRKVLEGKIEKKSRWLWNLSDQAVVLGIPRLWLHLRFREKYSVSI